MARTMLGNERPKGATLEGRVDHYRLTGRTHVVRIRPLVCDRARCVFRSGSTEHTPKRLFLSFLRRCRLGATTWTSDGGPRCSGTSFAGFPFCNVGEPGPLPVAAEGANSRHTKSTEPKSARRRVEFLNCFLNCAAKPSICRSTSCGPRLEFSEIAVTKKSPLCGRKRRPVTARLSNATIQRHPGRRRLVARRSPCFQRFASSQRRGCRAGVVVGQAQFRSRNLLLCARCISRCAADD